MEESGGDFMSRINTRQVEVYFTQPMDKKRFIQDILDEYMQYAFIGEIQM